MERKTLAERNLLKTNMPVKIDVELLKDEKLFRMKPQVALEKLVVDKKLQNITQSKEKKKPPIQSKFNKFRAVERWETFSKQTSG